jgi:YtcA-like protein
MPQARITSRLAVAILLPGCGLAPSVNILGSFFPAWLICIVVGVVLTILTRQLLVALDVASDLRPAALVYPCLGGLWIFATWLVLFGS